MKGKCFSGIIIHLILAAALFCIGIRAESSTIYVKTTGNDSNDGSTWDLAKQTVQAGLNVSVSGDEVWVAAGTYIQCITLKAGVALYGGFPASGGDWSARNTAANPTILDGNNSSSVVTGPPGATSTTVIDGFTIQNGGVSSGGGICCSSSSPTIANNTITGNSASYGGGVYCASSSPTITHNMITNNGVLGSGGGIYCSSASSPTITGNTITGNGAPRGGGIYCDGSSPTITNNTMIGNGAPIGGGLYCASSSPAVSNNIVAFNSSGLYNSGGAPVLRNNDVYGNTGYDYSGLASGSGDISADPLLVSETHGNLHIQAGSPCVNAGWNGAPGLPATDMDGQARLQDGTVDIGADESDGTTWPVVTPIIRVSPTGDDSNDGSSWGSAKKTVQASIDAAVLTGGEVWVKSGTYGERITLPLYAYVYGGFAGSETARSQRNWSENATILDGGGAGSVVTASCGYLLGAIDGFIIRNGSATYGGGIFCASSSPTVANNTIIGNNAPYGGSGGAIYCRHSLSMITNNTITGNSAPYGGGIFCASSSPTIANNTITGNGAACNGGGIHCSSSSPTIAGNMIAGNGACNGGGVYCSSSSSPTITNNTIVGNIGPDGGGIYCYRGSSPAISNSIVAFNSSGIYGSTLVLRNNDVYGNTGYDYSGLSAGLGDISADPLLVSETHGNLHIQAESPCVNAGWNDAPGLAATDMDGQARVQDETVDIGADESDGTTWPAVEPRIVRVSPTGDDANDGSSWGSAKKTVQAGINAAAAVGGEVWVAAGTYVERVTLPSYAYVYGGFAGSETSRSQRNWAGNVTILDGGQGGSVVTARCGYLLGAIDGFVIRNGTGSLVNGSRYGGGIYCSYFSPAITNNTITANSAASGGGIYCYSSSPTITNNTITANSAASGGGIHCYWYSSPTITNNTISANSATSGGGVYCYSYASPTVSNNIVAFNSSGFYSNGSTPVLRNNDVYGNTGYNYSGLSAGSGDILVDPQFSDRANGDYHIEPSSPCVDAGWDAPVQPGWLDMDSEPRIYGAHVDIGADEWTSRVAMPAFSPIGGVYNSPQTVIITCATPDAVIHYTSNGSSPTESDPVLTGPIPVNSSLTLKARAWKTDWTPSGIRIAAYTIQVATPTFSPGGGSYCSTLSVGVICATPGAVIHYTTNGNDPTESDAIVTGSVRVGKTMTLKARAWKVGFEPSTVKSAVYTLTLLSSSKKMPNNSTVTIPQAVVTAVQSASQFYVEADDRSCGVLVSRVSHGLTPGKRVTVYGTTQTLSSGEKYVNASIVTSAGTGTIRPLALNNRDVGGGDWFYNSSTKAGQQGVKDYVGGHPDISTYSSALNNIGILITTTGQVTYSTAGYFYVDDGYGLADNSGQVGIKVLGSVPPPDPVPPGWTPVGHHVMVTGISSCFKAASPSTDLYRQIWCSQVTLVQ